VSAGNTGDVPFDITVGADSNVGFI